MMVWSKYNFIFRSEEYGGLLYNALTNSFLAVPEKAYTELSVLQEGDKYECADLGLIMQLIAAGALSDPEEERRRLDVIRMQMRENFYSSAYPRLIILPTLGCNCACPYCFEKSYAPVHMSSETEAAVVKFAENLLPVRIFFVTWFGGEPLLRFEQIRRLTAKFQALPFKAYSANMITNGTLLTEDVISHLNEMQILNLQITLDGPQKIHDSRRCFASGGGTFQLILDNMDKLLHSSWKGSVRLRVNVDKNNHAGYAELFHALSERYKDYKERIYIYSGITVYDEKESSDHRCGMNPDEFAAFAIDELKRNVYTRFGYPRLGSGGCSANSKNQYVVGPEGELYKCLAHIGRKELRIGSVFPGEPWNNMLLARCLEGENLLNDPKCLACKCFPICDGGCVNMRMDGRNYCSYFRNYLPQLLEAYYSSLQKKQQ